MLRLVLIVALVAAAVVVSSPWLHVLVVAAIVALLVPVALAFARRES
jgi:hypothetical protein